MENKNPIKTLLGNPDEQVICKDFGSHASIHWYKSGAKVGDKCLCGKAIMRDDQLEEF